MSVTRRTLLGSALLAAAVPPMRPLIAGAHDATPTAERPDAPGYGIIRVRALPTAELNQAVFPDVMYRFLPETAAIPGYFGYLFAFDVEDPASSITMTLLADEAAVEQANAVAKEYVAGLDPRLTPETPLAEQGPVRIFDVTDRPVSELPPHLTGCYVTFRHRHNAPDTDIEAVLQTVQDGLLPILEPMEGFILYGWMLTTDGRIAFNIWETAEQLEAGNQVVADFVAANPVITSSGETEVYTGIIGYTDVIGV